MSKLSRVHQPMDRVTLPVEQVSWNDIQNFEVATRLQLPSEAQWEYACRAGTTSPWYCDYTATKRRETHPVGLWQPNQFGLHDMHGNVSEWCEDVFDSTFYSKDAPGFDPLSTAGSMKRVARGGNWGFLANRCRSARRDWVSPTTRFSNLGFRPVARAP